MKYLYRLLALSVGLMLCILPQGCKKEVVERLIEKKTYLAILSGKITPATSLGKEEDFYFNLATTDLYGPKTSNGWGEPFNLKQSV